MINIRVRNLVRKYGTRGPKAFQQLIIAHELGQAILHCTGLDEYVHEYTLTPRGRVEIEANRFAVELLINEKEIDRHHIENMGIDQLSSYFGVPKELVEYKFSSKYK